MLEDPGAPSSPPWMPNPWREGLAEERVPEPPLAHGQRDERASGRYQDAERNQLNPVLVVAEKRQFGESPGQPDE